MRRVGSLIIIFLILFSGFPQAGENRVEEITLLPIEGDYYLPLRPAAEFLGLSLRWEPVSREAFLEGRRVPGQLFAGVFHISLVDLAVAAGGELQWSADDKRGFLHVEDRSLKLEAPQRPRSENPPRVFLTFDDGPTEGTSYILKVLDNLDVSATFFLVGEQILKNPEIAREVVHNGHAVGNHSFTHPLLPELSEEAMYQEIFLTQKVFRKIIGVEPVLFRPPYGGWSAELQGIYEEMGLQLAWWSINPGDYNAPGTGVMVDQILTELEPGAVILLHCKMTTALALPSIINAIWEKGYDFDKLMGN